MVEGHVEEGGSLEKIWLLSSGHARGAFLKKEEEGGEEEGLLVGVAMEMQQGGRHVLASW